MGFIKLFRTSKKMGKKRHNLAKLSKSTLNYLKQRYQYLEDPVSDLGPIKYGYINGRKEVIKLNISEGEKNAAQMLKFCPSSFVCLPKIILHDIAIFDYRGEDLIECYYQLNSLSVKKRVRLWLKIVYRVMWIHSIIGLANIDIKLENILFDLKSKDPVLCDLESFVDANNTVEILNVQDSLNTPAYYYPYRPEDFKNLLAFEVYLLGTIYLLIRFPAIQNPMKDYDDGILDGKLTSTDFLCLRVCRKQFNAYNTCEQLLSDIYHAIINCQSIATVNWFIKLFEHWQIKSKRNRMTDICASEYNCLIRQKWVESYVCGILRIIQDIWQFDDLKSTSKGSREMLSDYVKNLYGKIYDHAMNGDFPSTVCLLVLYLYQEIVRVFGRNTVEIYNLCLDYLCKEFGHNLKTENDGYWFARKYKTLFTICYRTNSQGQLITSNLLIHYGFSHVDVPPMESSDSVSHV